jgi:hypothetical protein
MGNVLDTLYKLAVQANPKYNSDSDKTLIHVAEQRAIQHNTSFRREYSALKQGIPEQQRLELALLKMELQNPSLRNLDQNGFYKLETNSDNQPVFLDTYGTQRRTKYMSMWRDLLLERFGLIPGSSPKEDLVRKVQCEITGKVVPRHEIIEIPMWVKNPPEVNYALD